MTALDLYDNALIEINKIGAPSLLLEDYNYLINKAIQQYVNFAYQKYEANQMSVDDIRVLKATAVLDKIEFDDTLTAGITNSENKLKGTKLETSYFVELPRDYMHLQNCILEYTVAPKQNCGQGDKLEHFAVKRLTPDLYTQILNNAYMKPAYNRPYYYLHFINTRDKAFKPRYGLTSTNPVIDNKIMKYNNGSEDKGSIGTYGANALTDEDLNLLGYAKSNLVDSENTAGDRLANPTPVTMELRIGERNPNYTPNKVLIDYIKAPMYIRLTQDQINSSLDYSQVLEFPDYVCYEILNIFVRLLMENMNDPRLQTNMPINTTIGNPLTNKSL